VVGMHQDVRATHAPPHAGAIICAVQKVEFP
jgi:hypothetical protein